ncbi:MAG: hypothetical protein ACMVO3_22665 [Thalassobaculum sp.]
MAKFAAISWTILWIFMFLAPSVRMVQLGIYQTPTSIAVLSENMIQCFIAWTLGIIAIAALKVIFTDTNRPEPELATASQPAVPTRSEPRA